MKQEVIQDFLNLPGIAGIALMDRRSRPYFCGVDQTLNFQQKEALAQGILQVFETIPDEFQSFKFQFGEHQVYIHKLDHGIILLVLTLDNLVYSDYLKTIKNLKATLREDITNAIATFRLIAGTAILPGLNITRRTSTHRTESSTLSKTSKTQPVGPVEPSGSPPAPASASAPVSPGPAAPVDNGAAKSGSTPTGVWSVQDAIAALNQLSQFTTQYLGTHVIANYWKSTRPAHDWLTQFQIDRSAQISVINANPQLLQAALTDEQQTWLQQWVAEFIKRCTQVIRDFPNLIQQKALSAAQKSLLLG
ncbi:MAG: hypothetical protein NW220_10810 [Leptolyngbyaceae cyanobacterium bins.349]|nr:hypothetical protein [Leptolyngbyaceae cyanobacterium bins.349]